VSAVSKTSDVLEKKFLSYSRNKGNHIKQYIPLKHDTPQDVTSLKIVFLIFDRLKLEDNGAVFFETSGASHSFILTSSIPLCVITIATEGYSLAQQYVQGYS
jgi:hypothetical protein